MVTVCLGLGSNLGDRAVQMAAAVARLAAGTIDIDAVSGLYETRPVGGPPDQPDYLNAALIGRTSLSAEALLRHIQAIEAELGRTREVPHGPRTIDIDILLYGGAVRADRHPIVPHPRMHARAFVLVPLAEVAANTVHPLLRRTIGALRDDLGGGDAVRWAAGPGWHAPASHHTADAMTARRC